MIECGCVHVLFEFVEVETFTFEEKVKGSVEADRHTHLSSPEAREGGRVYLEDSVPPSDRVVVLDGSLLLFAEDQVEIELSSEPPVRVRFGGGRFPEPAIVVRQENVEEKRIGIFNSVDSREAEFLHQAILERAVLTLHAALGLPEIRRGCNRCPVP